MKVRRTIFTKRASLILEPLAVTAVTMRPSSGCKNTKGTAHWRDICDGQHCGARTLSSPTKYELVINTKTSKALGLTFPPAFLARADHVID